MTELELQAQVADYLRLQYPHVLFHSDFGSGIKLTPGQAMRQKRLQGGRRAWPDMFIAEQRPRVYFSVEKNEDAYDSDRFYCGLFIELKRENTRLFKKDGTFTSEHIKEQWETLGALTLRGYKAEFACGFDEAKKIIDEYLG